MAEKRYAPTARRLRDARRRGDVAFSRDVASTVHFVGVLAVVAVVAAGGFGALHGLWLQATGAPLLADPLKHLPGLMRHAAAVLAWAVAPVVAVAALSGLAGSFVQVGGLAAWQRLKPDMNRLNPAQGLQRVFSLRSLVDLAKMVLKTSLLGLLLFVVVRGFVPTALVLGHAHPATTLAVGGRVILECFGWAAVIYAVMAAVDYVHQRFEHIKQLRMSVEDLQREHREQEGDPLMASRRKSEHFQALYASLEDRVRVSSVLVHSARVAVALQYRGEDELPHVLARGQAELAAQMRRAADDAGLRSVFDPALAERLYDEVPQDMPIPRALFGPVARLLNPPSMNLTTGN